MINHATYGCIFCGRKIIFYVDVASKVSVIVTGHISSGRYVLISCKEDSTAPGIYYLLLCRGNILHLWF
jgi:hypothetical protein